jgi:hypothetical protein
MGCRRRRRRRAVIAGAAVAHHYSNKQEEQAAAEQGTYEQEAYEAPAPVPAAPSAADELEHLAQLHASGVLTDDEFAAAKAKVIGA